MDNKTRLQTNNINLNEILSTINDLPEVTTGGIDTSDATATTLDILSGKTAYVDGKKITGVIPIVAGKTITPSSFGNLAINGGEYASGSILISGDSDLIGSNIKKGVSIFGVLGSYEGEGGIDTSDATATSADIATGKTAYVNGEKVTGSMVIQSYYVSNVAPSSTLGNDGDLCLVRAGE